MVLGCREFEILSSCVHIPCFYASIREWFLLFNSRLYRHYTAVIMLPYQAHISPDTTYTETDSSSVGQGVHGEEFYVCLFLNKQINKQYITRLETGQLKKAIFGRYRNFTGSADLLSTYTLRWSKKNIFFWKKKFKMADSKKPHFTAPPILNIFSWKFHGLVLGLVELIDAKGISVAQLIWSWGCPT